MKFRPYPQLEKPWLARGGQYAVAGDETLVTPGGLAYLGIDFPPIGETNKIGAPRWITPLVAPSLPTAQEQLWLTLVGDSGMVWAVDTDKLLAAWLAHCGVQTPPVIEEPWGKVFLSTVNPSRYVRGDTLSTEAQEIFRGRNCLRQVLPSGAQITGGKAWDDGWFPLMLVRTGGVLGFNPEYAAHQWLPVEARAVEALLSLRARQTGLASTTTAAWALPTQPGAQQFKPQIEETRMKILATKTKVSLARVRDSAYRQALEAVEHGDPGQTLGGATVPSPRPEFSPPLGLPDGPQPSTRPRRRPLCLP